jgi:predicted transcriptional regulator
MDRPEVQRHSILELAPLELQCMNALWPLGEATVRDIQRALVPTHPRAYTTIMTILDRLAQKGVVVRRKSGRAWVYQAGLSAEQARADAIARIVEGFFEGSADALAGHLAAHGGSEIGTAPRPELPPTPRKRTAARPPARTEGDGLGHARTLDATLL